MPGLTQTAHPATHPAKMTHPERPNTCTAGTSARLGGPETHSTRETHVQCCLRQFCHRGLMRLQSTCVTGCRPMRPLCFTPRGFAAVGDRRMRRNGDRRIRECTRFQTRSPRLDQRSRSSTSPGALEPPGEILLAVAALRRSHVKVRDLVVDGRGLVHRYVAP